ncbi:ABC transporter ATP-binding protein [Desulfoluna limicola]|uniref:ABC transporter ATP-binding protein n=1 Tax=Desulfoluna limicola TaxID=2810562 RepID=A0ABM7PMJ6_9BACT|nr:ABC transporter ATP-binding protein [Desulfoluna limicola]BCS98754.1 ABC transporter ATP-binding protein [Desulfoluna limicola]
MHRQGNGPLSPPLNTIELTDITKTYTSSTPRNTEKNSFTALQDISLRIGLNQITLLKGPSGSGKTTLLSIIGCMARPSSGRIHFKGKEITSLPERFLAEIRRTQFGFIFQNYNLIRGMSVLDNVTLPAAPSNETSLAIRERAMRLLDKFKIVSKRAQKVEHLSGGEKQRVAIARALINDPDVIIADEPTAHLNTELSMEFLDILAGLSQEGKTILIASHDPLIFGASAVNHCVELRDGQIVVREKARCDGL